MGILLMVIGNWQATITNTIRVKHKILCLFINPLRGRFSIIELYGVYALLNFATAFQKTIIAEEHYHQTSLYHRTFGFTFRHSSSCVACSKE